MEGEQGEGNGQIFAPQLRHWSVTAELFGLDTLRYSISTGIFRMCEGELGGLGNGLTEVT